MENEKSVAVIPPKKEVRVVQDDTALSYLLDTARYEHTYRIAVSMSQASLIPSHLKGNSKEETAANCFLVVNQSLRWGFDPFAVAPETYSVGGKLAYQGKLVAAVINTRAKLVRRLEYQFNDDINSPTFDAKAKGDFLEVTVIGQFDGDDKPKSVKVSVGQAKTQNAIWMKDPHQKLCYSGAIKWARRWCPEVILGVMTEDDLDSIVEQEARGKVVQVVSADELKQITKPANVTEVSTVQPEPEPDKPKPRKAKEKIEQFELGATAKPEAKAEAPAPLAEGNPSEWSPDHEALRKKASDTGVGEAKLLEVLRTNEMIDESVGDIALISSKRAKLILNSWDSLFSH